MSWHVLTYYIIGWVICISMVLVVLRRQLTPGASLAWLGIVFLHPYIGLILYMLVGETRLGPNRAAVHRRLIAQFRDQIKRDGAGLASSALDSSYQPMVRQAERIGGMPILPGNSIEFLDDSAQMVNRLVADIDSAKTQINLLYYIFSTDQTGERVIDAICRAASRGVSCRVLADAVASRQFFRAGMDVRLRSAGVKVAAALPVALLRRRLQRLDLRNHRKLALIDAQIAYVGSQNLVNADYGGRRGAPWFDLTGRMTGPVVDELISVFCEDWAFETGEELRCRAPGEIVASTGDIPMQVVPTGPSAPGKTYRRVLLAAIQCAQTRVILTTPYFVPDEPTLIALMMAADRGVEVNLILPSNPDHFFTAAAGRAHFASLLEAGVAIYLYRPGLLHSKSVTVDDAFAVFGSANIDVRSFNLNFELSVLLYGQRVTDQIRQVQLKYLAESDRLDAAEWSKRPAVKRYADGAIALLSPLL